MTPNRKVGLAGVAGAITTLIVGILSMNNIQLTAEMTAAATTVVMFATGYLVPEPKAKA